MAVALHHYVRRNVFWIWIVPALGLLLTAGASLFVWHQLNETEEQQFAAVANQVEIKVRERLESFELILLGGAAVLESNPSITRQQWRQFAGKVAADNNANGMQGIGFARAIAAGDLARHVASVRAEGFDDYAIRPTGERPFYSSIIYLEPFTGRNLRAFGFDMFAEPVRRAAMEQARDTGLAALSGKVRLVQETEEQAQAGVLMYVPVYAGGMSVNTVEQRRAALIGWAYSPYRMQDMFNSILKDWSQREGHYVDLHVYDGTEESPEKLLFDSWLDPHSPGLQSTILQRRVVDFHGHQWLLEFGWVDGKRYVSFESVKWTFAGGLLLTLLLRRLIWQLLITRERAQEIAGQLTEDLRLREAELLEAQRIGRIGVWKMNLHSNNIVWSESLQQIFGLGPDSQDLALQDYEHFFAPESWQKLVGVLAGVLENHAPYEAELEVIDIDGTHRWLLVRGEYVSDPKGTFTGLHGTAVDVTERVKASQRIATLTRFYAALGECNMVVARCSSRDELFTQLCDLVVRRAGMTMAWIGLVEPETGRIVPQYWAGTGTGYLDSIEISVLADDPHGRGPTGTAVRENRPMWVDDFGQSPMTSPWSARGSSFGWRASASVPICEAGNPIGALTFYSTQGNWADEETRHLLEQMAASLSYALDKLAAEQEAMAIQASLIESEHRFRVLVEQSISGAFILQDDKIVYVNPRCAQIFGYALGTELVGHSPLEVIAEKDRAAITLLMQKMQSGEQAAAQALFTGLRLDGGTVELGVSTVVAVYQSRPAIIGMLQDISDRKVAEDQIRRYAQQLEHTFMQTVGLANTLSEMRDPYTAGHERRVAEIAVAIGHEMGLDPARLEGLRIGGYLHDVGKITVPAEILAKPTRLTPVEYSLIQAHAQAGYDILKEVDFPWPVAQIAYQHHERMDGSGYPQGLKGEAILLEARITAVADVVESMASHRPYRPGLGIDKALAEIERGTGTAYDPVVAAACLRLFREKGYVIPAQ